MSNLAEAQMFADPPGRDEGKAPDPKAWERTKAAAKAEAFRSTEERREDVLRRVRWGKGQATVDSITRGLNETWGATWDSRRSAVVSVVSRLVEERAVHMIGEQVRLGAGDGVGGVRKPSPRVEEDPVLMAKILAALEKYPHGVSAASLTGVLDNCTYEAVRAQLAIALDDGRARWNGGQKAASRWYPASAPETMKPPPPVESPPARRLPETPEALKGVHKAAEVRAAEAKANEPPEVAEEKPKTGRPGTPRRLVAGLPRIPAAPQRAPRMPPPDLLVRASSTEEAPKVQEVAPSSRSAALPEADVSKAPAPAPSPIVASLVPAEAPRPHALPVAAVPSLAPQIEAPRRVLEQRGVPELERVYATLDAIGVPTSPDLSWRLGWLEGWAGARRGAPTLGAAPRVSPAAEAAARVIIEGVAQAYKLTLEDLLRGGRERVKVRARAIAMFLARTHTRLLLGELAALFGEHHGAILAAVNRIEDEIDHDSDLRDAVNDLESRLGLPHSGIGLTPSGG